MGSRLGSMLVVTRTGRLRAVANRGSNVVGIAG